MEIRKIDQFISIFKFQIFAFEIQVTHLLCRISCSEVPKVEPARWKNNCCVFVEALSVKQKSFFFSPFDKIFSAAQILSWQNVNVKPTHQWDWQLIACWVINLSIRAGFHRPSLLQDGKISFTCFKIKGWIVARQRKVGAGEGVVAIFMERQLNSTVLLLSERSNYLTTTRWLWGLKVQTSPLFTAKQLWRNNPWLCLERCLKKREEENTKQFGLKTSTTQPPVQSKTPNQLIHFQIKRFHY